jgi:hypothetical protein
MGEIMTLTQSIEIAFEGPASRYVRERPRTSLSDAVEQLAGLRFSIVLSARQESSGVLTAPARAELRDELRRLRSRYSDKIDEIAMNYGVQAAIDAKEGVEREVVVPKTMMPPVKTKYDSPYEI